MIIDIIVILKLYYTGPTHMVLHSGSCTVYPTPIGALERWCVCRGDHPIKINVVVKVGGGPIQRRSPKISKWGDIPPRPLLQRPLLLLNAPRSHASVSMFNAEPIT